MNGREPRDRIAETVGSDDFVKLVEAREQIAMLERKVRKLEAEIIGMARISGVSVTSLKLKLEHGSIPPDGEFTS